MSKYWLFRVAAAIAPRLPFGLLQTLAGPISLALWALAGTARQRADRNLRHIPVLVADPQRRGRAVRGIFYHLVLNYVDFLRGRALTDAQILAGWTVERQEVVERAMAQGRGLILLTAHVGDFEMGAMRLGAMGYSLVAPVERMKPEAVYQLFVRLREHHHFRFLPADSPHTMRALMEALKRNEIAVFAVDRYVEGSATAEMNFFGAPAKMALGPMALALRLNIPVATAFSWREGPQHHGVFTPLDLSGEMITTPDCAGATTTSTTTRASRVATSNEAMLGAQRLYIEHLETYIRAHPEQWIAALSPVWEAA